MKRFNSHQFSLAILGGVIVLLLLSACNSSNPVTINLKENNVNQFIRNATATQDAQFWINGVDMKDGFMRVFMVYRKSNGSELNGSYDMTLRIENGEIKADIIEVDMPGLELNQQILDQISALIARDFVFAASRLGGKVEFQGINLTEDNLEMNVVISP